MLEDRMQWKVLLGALVLLIASCAPPGSGVTTVFVARHAEKLNPDGHVAEEPLSPAGTARAKALRAMLERAGVTAIYSTDTVRTLGTAAPLAARLQLEPILYTDPEELGQLLLQSASGDVVLVVGHSNTIGPVATALGGEVPEETVGDYDNLLVISRSESAVNVMNLQFGEESGPDRVKTHNQGSQLLLVEEVDAGSTGSEQARRLAHRLKKAGLSALLATGGHTTFSVTSGRLGLPIRSLDGASLPDSIGALLDDHPRQNIAISASRALLAGTYIHLSGSPAPLGGDGDRHLLLVTPGQKGVRIVLLTY